MIYPAQFTPDEDGGFVVTFRDIPEAITQGDDFEDAIIMAEDALLTAMDFYFETNRAVPLPSIPQNNETLISLPASAWAKVLLLNEMVNQGITNAELARRLNTRPQEVQRIMNLQHTTKIDTISAALLSLGKHLNIGVSPA